MHHRSAKYVEAKPATFVLADRESERLCFMSEECRPRLVSDGGNAWTEVLDSSMLSVSRHSQMCELGLEASGFWSFSGVHEVIIIPENR